MNKIIDIRSISASYGGRTVLRDVSLTLWENDFLGIIGPNGGGKTTLLKVILGLLAPAVGSVQFFDGRQPVDAITIGYLPQVNSLDRHFPISVGEVVASGLMASKRLLRPFTAAQRERTAAVLDWIGLGDASRRSIAELSGGELQRVLLGRAIVSNPRVLILDEPNTYVDRQFASRLYDLLADINRDTAIILVSHDIGAIIPLIKNVACVNETLHYHAGNDLTEKWLDGAYQCPVELVRHGDVPHRVLRNH
jgi:zinc transport system ATP-binding protein